MQAKRILAAEARDANEGYVDFNHHSITQQRGIVFRGFVLAAMILASAGTYPGVAQVAPATTLEVDVENIVLYSSDVFDALWFAKWFATDPNLTTVIAGARNFGSGRNLNK